MSIPIPFIPNFSNFAIDDFVIFIVSALFAIMVNAEGQAFAAITLGDSNSEGRNRLHFNAFLYLDILGTLSFFLLGFGWPKKIDIDTSQFSRPKFYNILTRFAGPFANFLLASIAGSIVWILTKYGSEDRVFTMVVIVNVTVAAYNLLPIAPLAGSSIVSAFFSSENNKFLKFYQQAGPFILIGLFLAEIISGKYIISSYFKSFAIILFNFITTF